MRNRKNFVWHSQMLLLAVIGGGLFSLTGLGVGWLIGATFATALFQLLQRQSSKKSADPVFHPFWKRAAQVIVALQISEHISGATLKSFQSGWPTIVSMLVFTLLFSIMSGVLFYKLSGVDLRTSLYALTPGGISGIPALSQESGGNPALVSAVHVLRIGLVTILMPLLAFFFKSPVLGPLVAGHAPQILIEPLYETILYEAFEFLQPRPFAWTLVLLFSVWASYHLAKKLKLPAPLLVGGISAVTLAQIAVSSYANYTILPWLPHWLMIAAQILLGASLGTKVNREMFTGAGRALAMGALSVVGLLFFMTGCSVLLCDLTNIPLITSLLSFAPGGVAEMAATSSVMKANSSFVITAQTLRLILVYTLLPILINQIVKFANRRNPV